MPDRAGAIERFLAASDWRAAKRQPLPSDASFRRYVRLVGGPRPALLMDAPPPHENVRAFSRVARHLVALGLSAPRLYAADEDAGLLVIEDFGDETYARRIAAGDDERALYALAIDVLIALHRAPEAAALAVPDYDDARLIDNAALLLDWFLPAMTGRATPPAAAEDYRAAWRAVLPLRHGTPPALALRDFHVDNLMIVPGRDGVGRCGLLDFQDANRAPAAYDLVSLVEDARRDIAPALKEALVARYRAAFPGLGAEALRVSLAVMGAQRHARVIGVFARLWRRDGKPRYLPHIPRVWRLLGAALSEPELAPVRRWFDRHAPPELRRAPRLESAAPPVAP
jgi:hypothetical protein